MNKLDKQLTLLYVATLIIAIGVYANFEFVAPLTVAPLAGIPHFEDVKYISEVATDLLALAFVYLSLKLMVLGFVRRSIDADNSKYAKWAFIRWGMLAVVMFLGEAVHYLFLSPSTVGCPIIAALALIFVWPTKGRREREINYTPE